MKFDAPPKRIWLQLHGDCEPEYPVDCGEETTWCWESIFPSDTEYVRADIAEQMVKDAREECAEIADGFDTCDPSYIARRIMETIK